MRDLIQKAEFALLLALAVCGLLWSMFNWLS